MLLTGSITVTPQGAVQSYTVEKSASLPAPVQRLLVQNVPHWRFQPVISNGQAVAAKTAMHLRIVASPTDKDHYALRIASEWFGDPAGHGGLSYKNRTPPLYPERALMDRVSGTVYLIAHINRQGQFDKVATEQVDLRVRGPETLMRLWRKVLADASVQAVSHWTLNVPAKGMPAEGPLAHHKDWIVRVPISYSIRGYDTPQAHRYGQWTAYIPGPREKIPWLKPNAFDPDNADALPDNGLYLAQQSLHLLATPKS